ncbi:MULTISPECIES: glycosyltransferase family 2 protein [unclassified Exiguobacterium]|uniref:glycosyltransferase family 2 protein n=1 Tax=unclassified Exiguobacterium TaxID=2644629 RepID=UPI001BEC6F55|nr:MULTISPECIES: glycosyltransferase family 2 protein [unclassified Exiguobacterium]
MNKVSIITPVYNCEKYLTRTIESVQKQTYENWEMILIDDCSTDTSKEIIRKFEIFDERIKYIKNQQNSGAALSRNKGIEVARGDFIAFLDSDDVWDPYKLEKQLNFMIKNKYDFSSTAYNKINENNEIILDKISVQNEMDYKNLLKYNCGNSTVMYNAKNIGKFFIPNIRKRNDYLMWLTIIKKTKKIYGLNEVLASHRIRSGSISQNKLSLIKYHWIVYRTYEKLSIFKTIGLIHYWIIKGLKNKKRTV